MKNKRIALRLLAGVTVLSVVSIIFIILAFSKYTFHSDCAAYLLQAKEQVKQMKLFPDRFHYTTAIFGFTTSVFMAPFVKIIQNDFLLHEIGSIIAILVLVSLVLALFRSKKKCGMLTIILFFIPISYTYMDMLFFQSAYINICTLMVLNLYCVSRILSDDILLNTKKGRVVEKKKFINLFLYFVVVILTNYYGVAKYIYLEIPLILSLVVLMWTKKGAIIREWWSERRLIAIFVITITGIFASILIYRCLCNKLGFDTNIHSGGMVDASHLHDHIKYVFSGLLGLFGIEGTKSLLSLKSFNVCICIAYFVTAIFIAPIVLVKNIKKFESDTDKFLILFSSLLCYIVLFVMFFGGMSEARYFLPAMFGCAILISYFVIYISENFPKQVCKFPYLIVLVFAMMIHRNYYVEDVPNNWYDNLTIKQIVQPTVSDELVDYLEEQGITYGYATFWQSYSHMINSNSNITIAAYDQGNPLMPFYFNSNSKENINYYACSEDLYNPDLHPGKCFVLVAPGETIPEKYYVVANDILHKNGFTILVYEKNIQLYEELTEKAENSSYICINNDYGFDFSIQEYNNKSFCQAGSLYLLGGGSIQLNYIDLLTGKYEVMVKGENIEDISMTLVAEDVQTSMQLGEEQEECQVFCFEVSADRMANKIEIANTGSELCKITSVVIKKQ